MKSYPLKIEHSSQEEATNRFQHDFLYLKTLADEVVPLADRYFPREQRRKRQAKILQQLGKDDCGYETFVPAIEHYLAGFNNEHARIVENPKPIRFNAQYPFRVHYVTNELYLLDIAREYEPSLVGQRIARINGRSVADIEQKLFEYVSAENAWTKRAALQLSPFPYTRPEFYHRIGLIPSTNDSITLELADGATVLLASRRNQTIQWHRAARPPHPITAGSPHSYDCQIFPEQRFAYLQFNACFDKTAILDGLEMVRPSVRPLVRAWLATQFPRKKPAAVLRGIYDPERPVFKDYLSAVFRDINDRGVTNLIIDLRRNRGGASELCNQLLYHLTTREDLTNSREFNYNVDVLAHYDPDGAREYRAWYRKEFDAEPPPGHLLPTPPRPVFEAITNTKSLFYVSADRQMFTGRIVVLANQGTGSAASLLAALIQDNKLGVIVGTPTANNPTGPTGMTPFRLPRSGVIVSLPTDYEERAAPANGPVLQPDHWVEDSVADIQTGRDAGFEKALQLLQVDNTRSGTLTGEDIEGAICYLKKLKENGEQPGWSKNDKGAAYLKNHSYFGPKALTFHIRKNGDASVYEYTVMRAEDGNRWKLRKALRLDKNGRTREDYGRQIDPKE